MAYDIHLADRIRTFLADTSGLEIEEKKMFGGLGFIINGKMCINVSGENMMCRFDPLLLDKVSAKKGFQPMIMNGKNYKGYCYVAPEGFRSAEDFEFWMDICLAFNDKAKSSKKKKKLR